MIQSILPSVRRQLDDDRGKLLETWWKGGWNGIESPPPFTWAAQQDLLRDLILDEEKIGVKLNICVVIKIKMMNGDEMFMCVRNMMNIV
jgi:hypothetical protein